ncbi:unnamed protein product, partial [Iphiclides podalirius]
MRKKRSQADGNTSSEVKELTEEVRLLTREISSLKNRLEAATTSLTSCHTRLEELGSSIAVNDHRLKQLETRDQQVKLLEAKVEELNQELNAQEQNHLSNEMELAGIPEHGGENLQHIVLLAAKKVGVTLDDCDIDWVARVGPRTKPAISTEHEVKFSRPVVVRLLRRNKKNNRYKFEFVTEGLAARNVNNKYQFERAQATTRGNARQN